MKRSPIRLAGIAGIAGAVLLNAALFLPGLPPRTDEPTRQVVSFALTNRSDLLVGAFLGTLALFAVLWMISGVWRMLAGGDQDLLLTAGALAGAFGLLLIVTTMGLVAGLVLEAAKSHDLALVRFVTDAVNIITQVGLLLVGGFAFAASLAGRARGRLPSWAVLLGLVSTAVIVVTSLPVMLVSSGPWQAGGIGALAATGPLSLWFLAVAILMVRAE